MRLRGLQSMEVLENMHLPEKRGLEQRKRWFVGARDKERTKGRDSKLSPSAFKAEHSACHLWGAWPFQGKLLKIIFFFNAKVVYDHSRK